MKSREKIFSSVYHVIIWLLWAVIMCSYIVSCIWGQKYLFCDGSMVTFNMITQGKVMVYPPGRRNFDYVVQIIAALASQMGCRDYRLLANLYGLGLTCTTALTTGVTLLVSKKREQFELGIIALIIVTIQMIFMGHYVIVESLFAMAVFFQEVILYLLHKDDKNKKAYWEYGLIAFHLFFTIHLMEYFCAWAPVLVIILIYRVFSKNNEIKLNRKWLFVAVWQCVIAVWSYLDIDGRGTAPGVSDLWKVFYYRKFYLYSCIGLGVIAGFILVWTCIAKRRNWIGYGLVCFMAFPIFYKMFNLVRYRTDTLVANALKLRWSNLPWGVLGGLFLLLFFVCKKKEANRIFMKFGYAVLLSGICLISVYFHEKSAIGQRAYHEQMIAYCETEHPNEGFIDINTTDFKTQPWVNYSNSWTTAEQCVDLFAIYKKGEITTILYDGGELDVKAKEESLKGIQQYGLMIKRGDRDK